MRPNGLDPQGALGNERLTAMAGGVLLVLLAIEIATTLALRSLMPAHVFVGVLLVGPLVVKLGSTGYRFVRYYAGSVPYVHRGPPMLSLRILAVPLVAVTLILLASGGALLLTGPIQPGPLIAVHNISTLVWLPLVAVHVVAYLRRLPRLIALDVLPRRFVGGIDARIRFALTIGAIGVGAILAMIALPIGEPWATWAQSNDQVPAPIIVGTVLTAAVLLIARPMTWTASEPTADGRA